MGIGLWSTELLTNGDQWQVMNAVMIETGVCDKLYVVCALG